MRAIEHLGFPALARPTLIPVLFALLVVAAPAAAQQPGFHPCYSYRIHQNLLHGEFALSLPDLKQCADSYRALTQHLAPGGTLKPAEWLDILAYSRFRCAVAQVTAITGHHGTAATLLADIKRDSQSWWHTNSMVDEGWRATIDATEGFLIEARGDLASAEQWYSAHPSRYTLGRLAVVQLSQGRDAAASETARRALALDPENPSANYVVGVIADRRGDLAKARQAFDTAYHSLAGDAERLKRPTDMDWPIKFVEALKIVAARDRTSP